MGKQFDTAQVCLNGHLITNAARQFPQFQKKFCDECGAVTINQCQNCQEDIQGEYINPNVVSFLPPPPPPSFCINCGSSFPWTQSRLSAAKALTEDLDTLDAADKAALIETLPDLVRDTPMTKVAEGRFKRLMKKAGSDAYDSMKSILTDVISETIKKTLFSP